MTSKKGKKQRTRAASQPPSHLRQAGPARAGTSTPGRCIGHRTGWPRPPEATAAMVREPAAAARASHELTNQPNATVKPRSGRSVRRRFLFRPVPLCNRPLQGLVPLAPAAPARVLARWSGIFKRMSGTYEMRGLASPPPFSFLPRSPLPSPCSVCAALLPLHAHVQPSSSTRTSRRSKKSTIVVQSQQRPVSMVSSTSVANACWPRLVGQGLLCAERCVAAGVSAPCARECWVAR